MGIEVDETEARRLTRRLRFANLQTPAPLRFHACPALLVIDELGYLPLPGEVAAALFQVVSQRYLKTPIVITTNRSVGSWEEVLGGNTVAAALLDRLLHRSMVINLDGDSCRLRDHQATAENLRRLATEYGRLAA